MKTQDELIKEQIGINLDAIDTTPMDKGECKICMTAWAEYYHKEQMKKVKSNYQIEFKFIDRTDASIHTEIFKAKTRDSALNLLYAKYGYKIEWSTIKNLDQ